MRPLFFALVALALFTAPAANAHVLKRPKPIERMTLVEKERLLVRTVAHAAGAVRFLERVYGPPSPAARRETRFHRVQLRIARETLSRARAAIVRARHPRDYASAVRLVERFYGPQPFLWACPRSEGGFGLWTWNGPGRGYTIDRYPAGRDGSGIPPGSSGAGGWLQFIHSTFESVSDAAIADARARGMIFDRELVDDWRSPLGQALAGLEMLRAGRAGEWTGSTC